MVKKRETKKQHKRLLPLFGILCVLVLSWSLNSTALHWGQTGRVPWSSDSIEGTTTTYNLPNLFKMWKHKYPRGQYLISSVFYNPLLEKWKNDPVVVRYSNGKTGQAVLDQPRLYKLASITRWITVVMSSGIVIAVFLTGRKLFDGDNVAGILSALCLALSCHFVFYSKTGCVDVPAFFWFAWAGCFGVYAIKTEKLAFYLLAGFCSAWSVCTKESVATFQIGLALGLTVMLVCTKLQAGAGIKKAMTSLVNWKVILAVVIAAMVFITLEGFWGGMEEWHYRSKFWNKVVNEEFKTTAVSNMKLLTATYNGLYKGWGTPFMVLLSASIIYWFVKYKRQVCLVVLPLITFFFLTVLVIRLNLPRFMMCGYSGIAILMGKTLADWYRAKKIPIVVRHVLPLLILIPSLVCCVCYNLEMKNSSRMKAESWIKENVAQTAMIGMTMNQQYTPRVWVDGYRVIPEWNSKGVNTPKGKIKVWPDYIVCSNIWTYASRNDKEFFKNLSDGKTDYVKQVQYGRTYFRKKTLIWKICLRFYDLHALISQPMFIYKKELQTS